MKPPRPVMVILLLGLAIGIGAAPAPPVRQVLDQARRAYEEGRFDQAAQLYEDALVRAPHDARLLYNGATAHARAGHRGLAVWRYLQALRLRPRDADIRHNLTIVLPDWKERTAISPLPPLNWLYRRWSMNEWAIGAGALTVAGLGFLLLGLLLPRGGRVRCGVRPMIVASILLAAVCWPFAWAAFYHQHVLWKGVVVAEDIVSRTGPGLTHMENFALPVGTLVRLQPSVAAGWVKITFGGDKVGFVQREQVRGLRE